MAETILVERFNKELRDIYQTAFTNILKEVGNAFDNYDSNDEKSSENDNKNQDWNDSSESSSSGPKMSKSIKTHEQEEVGITSVILPFASLEFVDDVPSSEK